jgi:hypothetical protein
MFKWPVLAGNLIFSLVFEWLKQDGRPLKNENKLCLENKHIGQSGISTVTVVQKVSKK